ncbi:PH domain-containing protein [uncultured Clostridium sp.]|jgi:putative membrane protein|uniref:PH domain-containing protein n=1 Tax=uncultured Clostridium sp. TaxID=59620 RepID=UPI00262607F1|nr:PH domain-containing protein [uncultured Clostridium sp.]
MEQNNLNEVVYKSASIAVIVKMTSFVMNWIFLYLVFFREPIVLVSVTLIVLGYYLVLMRFEYIKICKDEVFYNRGIIMKKSLRIHKERLKSMDISKNIVGRIFNFSTVKIETAVMGGVEDTTIRMYLKDNEISEIKEYLLSNLNSYEEECEREVEEVIKVVENIVYENKISAKDLFLGGLTSAGFFIVVFAIFQGGLFLGEIGQQETVDNTMAFAMSNFSKLHVGILGIIFIVSFILINIAVGIVNIVKFYNFTLVVTEEKINIKYGLLNVREFSFARSDIKAVVVNSNPIRQVLSYSDIKLEVKGYSGFGDAAIMLTPFIKNSELDKIFKNVLLGFIIDEKVQKFEKAKAFYVMKPIVINLVISIVLFVVFKSPYTLLWNLFSIFSLIGRLLIIKNTELSFNKKVLRGVSGGFYKVEKRINPRNIQAISAKESRLLSRLGIANILIYYYSEVGGGLSLAHLSKDNLLRISRTLSSKEDRNEEENIIGMASENFSVKLK